MFCPIMYYYSLLFFLKNAELTPQGTWVYTIWLDRQPGPTGEEEHKDYK